MPHSGLTTRCTPGAAVGCGDANCHDRSKLSKANSGALYGKYRSDFDERRNDSDGGAQTRRPRGSDEAARPPRGGLWRAGDRARRQVALAPCAPARRARGRREPDQRPPRRRRRARDRGRVARARGRAGAPRGGQLAGPRPRPRRSRRARPAARSRQLRHRGAPPAGRARRPPLHDLPDRRRLAARAARWAA